MDARVAGQGNRPAAGDDKKFAPFEAKGGVVDGSRLSAADSDRGQQVADAARSS